MNVCLVLCIIFRTRNFLKKCKVVIQIVLSLIAWRNTRGPNERMNNNCTVTLELILTKDHSNILINVAYMKYHYTNNWTKHRRNDAFVQRDKWVETTVSFPGPFAHHLCFILFPTLSLELRLVVVWLITFCSKHFFHPGNPWNRPCCLSGNVVSCGSCGWSDSYSYISGYCLPGKSQHS